MTYKDPEVNRAWHKARKAEIRAELRDLRDAMPLHRRLGIETYTHRQAVVDYHGGFDRETGQYWSPHQYREVVTLARSA